MKFPWKPEKTKKFRAALLSWYDREKRDLPWRRNPNPYVIFLSEAMLQQTQVQTARPYFERFLSAFPDWRALAQAPEEKVLKLWAGLGYYRRAKHLHEAARIVHRTFNDRLPQTSQELQKLPGVGPYTAGAILSIAFQKPVALVDGNVARVFSRIFRIPGDPREKNRKLFWNIAERLLDRKRPGDFNQALMELGALICVPKKPLCLLCPLHAFCSAAQKGEQTLFPEKRERTKFQKRFFSCALIQRKNRILLRKRGRNERWWKELWEFPSAEGENAAEALRNLQRQYALQVRPEPLTAVSSTVTHHRLLFQLYRVKKQKKVKRPFEWRWVARDEMQALAMGSAQSRLRRWVLEKNAL